MTARPVQPADVFVSHASAPFNLQAGTTPTFVDIDGDGDLDAISGLDGTYGNVQLNDGSATDPNYDAAQQDRFGLASFGSFGYIRQYSFVDIDADGDLDAFALEPQGLNLQLNTGSAIDPVFGPLDGNPFGLSPSFVDLNPTTVTFADIDGDGDADLFAGTTSGLVMFRNTGSASAPVFGSWVATPFGLSAPAGASAAFVDFDRDGDLDAFVAADGGTIQLVVNTGSATLPSFAATVANPYGLGSGYPVPVDIDADGDLDMFVGGVPTGTAWFENTGRPLSAVDTTAADGEYGVGTTIELSVAFSEAVTVDTAGGTPTLLLETGATDRKAIYAGGSGTSTLSFTYTVQAGDVFTDLDIASATALALEGGTIRDAGGQDASLVLPTPGAYDSFSAHHAIASAVDLAAPAATLVTSLYQAAAPVVVRSSEPGTAYLVKSTVAVTSVASITSAADALWNSQPIAAANTDTSISVAGLGDGSYRLYTVDASGNLSQPAAGSLALDMQGPRPLKSSDLFTGPQFNPFGIAATGSQMTTSFGDLDGDGDLDLVQGNSAGETRVQLNTGTATAPAFGTSTVSRYGLSSFSNNTGHALADIDRDGDLDAFIGSKSNLHLQLNTGTATAPSFGTAVAGAYGLTASRDYSKPVLGDLDADGDLDVVVGLRGGDIQFYINTGSSSSPFFGAPLTNAFGTQRGGMSLTPALADIDNDGDLDLFTGSHSGATLFMENIGNAVFPSFAAPVAGAFGLPDLGVYSMPTFADIDGDGDLDAFIGEHYNGTALFLNTGKALTPVKTTSANGNYGTGSTISIQVSFTEAVYVTGGVPSLQMNTAGGTAGGKALYTGGSGTSTLTFTYTVQAGDSSADLDIASAAALSLEGASILDAAGNSASALDLVAPGASGSLGLRHAMVVDGIAPAATVQAGPVQLPANGAATVRSTEAGTAYLVKDSVVVTNVASITGANTSTWNEVAITAANTDAALPTSGLESGTYRLYSVDAAGNLSAPAAASLVVDAQAPRSLKIAELFGSAQANPFGIVNLGGKATHAFADLDGDGDLDLVSGASPASTWVQLNNGTAAAPAFGSQVAGRFNLSAPASNTAHAFVDIDDDGDLDAFIGTKSQIYRQENTGTSTAPAFASQIAAPDGLSASRNYVKPVFGDLDGDGDMDAVVGLSNGDVQFYINTGSAAAASFAAPLLNAYGVQKVGSQAAPALADIDGDGDLDLFLGASDGQTRFLQNIGSASTPSFAAPEVGAFGLTDVGTDSTPTFADVDGDGDLDAFIGSGNGNTYYFSNTGRGTALVNSPAANGTYGIGSTIAIQVPFSEAVYVTGVPSLRMNTGAGTAGGKALYTGGSGTSTLTFTYTVQAGDSSADLDMAGVDALSLEGGSIRDAAGNAAVLDFPVPGAMGSLSAARSLVADGIAPGATLVPDVLLSAEGNAATVRSSEPGTAYLVNASIAVTDVASITRAAPAGWNEVAIAAANTDTSLSTTGLLDGEYRLYVADAAGNLSAASGAAVLIDAARPVPVMEAGSFRSSDSAPVRSTEAGEAYLVSTSVAVTDLASITGALDSQWNSMPVSGGTTAFLSLDGLAEGVYKLYVKDTAGHLSAGSAASVTIDDTAPAASMAPVALPKTASVTVRSSEAGTAYLVNATISVTDVGSITAAAGNTWNEVAITAADTDTALPAAGLVGGLYRLFTTDAAGNLSIASAGAALVDSKAPTAALVPDSITPLGTATVRSSESGSAWLVNSSVAVSDLASITAAADGNWNMVPVVARTSTPLDASGLAEGSYRLYTSDAAGNVSAASSASVVVDATAPTASLASATIAGTGSFTVRSSEAGTAYLVKSTVAVTDLASITSSANNTWNKVAVMAADTDTALAATGLSSGGYSLYTVDAAGNLSAATGNLAFVDTSPNIGTAGNDTLKGVGGDESLEGLGGDDRLSGMEGKDTLDGGAGNDKLSGGGGDDLLVGAGGNDSLTGGPGADVFFFDGNSGRDAIADFVSGEGDRIHITAHANDVDWGGSVTPLSQAVQTATGVLIQLGDANTIRLVGVQLHDLDASDFIIV